MFGAASRVVPQDREVRSCVPAARPRDPVLRDSHPPLSGREWLAGAAALGFRGLGLTSGSRLGSRVAEAQGGATPKPGGASVWAAEADPVALNPITTRNFSSTQGFEHCYEADRLRLRPEDRPRARRAVGPAQRDDVRLPPPA
jgi:hypothetical protein